LACSGHKDQEISSLLKARILPSHVSQLTDHNSKEWDWEKDFTKQRWNCFQQRN